MNKEPNEKKKKLSGRMKFLLVMVIVYIFIFIFNHELAISSIGGTLAMLARIIPILAIVFLAMAGVNLFIESGKMEKYLGGNSGLKGWIYATIAGILISGPPYVLYPMLRELKIKGMKNDLLAVFLYNRNVKIPFIPAMAFYFGWTYTVVFSFYIIVFSFLNGALVGKILQKSKYDI